MDNPGDLSAFWFKAGAGFDVSLTGSVFLRTTATAYGLRTNWKKMLWPITIEI